MTTGQRIAQKRKELALSQETLGDKLGVSRQAIYKWEADAALPEVEKLIALSKLFGVSVGWLLGVEDVISEPSREDGELTEQQLKMVEEIVDRYLAAQPKPSKTRILLIKICIAAAGICLAIGMYSLVARLDRLNSQYNSLQNSVGLISSGVDSQIAGISGRVESILKAHNDLTAEYGAELTGFDCEKGTASFSLRAVPKTYVEGMSALFLADSDGDVYEFHTEAEAGQTFACDVFVPLSDKISLSVVFILPDGTRQTQLLDTFYELYSSTLPFINVHSSFLSGQEVPDGQLSVTDLYVTIIPLSPMDGDAEVRDVKVGLFRNQKLVVWAEPCVNDNYQTIDGEKLYLFPDTVLKDLTKEDSIAVAAVASDSYGRQFVDCDVPYVLSSGEDATPYLTYPDEYYHDPDPKNWSF